MVFGALFWFFGKSLHFEKEVASHRPRTNERQQQNAMAQQQALEQPLVQWGRFTLVSKELPNESDHLYFCKNEHRIGRNRVRSDLILDKLWISSVVPSSC